MYAKLDPSHATIENNTTGPLKGPMITQKFETKVLSPSTTLVPIVGQL